MARDPFTEAVRVVRDERQTSLVRGTKATLDVLVDFGDSTQVLLLSHHRAARDAASRLGREGRTTAVEVRP